MAAKLHGTFNWNELITGDVEKAKTFFAETIGWSYDGMPMGPEGGTYWIAMQDGKPVAGIMSLEALPDGVPPHWMSYLAVDDVDARLKKASTAGGTIIREAFDIPNVGRIAIIADPTGAVMGWITPTENAAG